MGSEKLIHVTSHLDALESPAGPTKPELFLGKAIPEGKWSGGGFLDSARAHRQDKITTKWETHLSLSGRK